MVGSVDDLKTSQSIVEHRFPNFEMLHAKIASALKKIITSVLQEENQSGRPESTNEGPISQRKTDSSYDLRILPSYWRS